MFKLTSFPLENIKLKDGLAADEAGAFACFEGRVRNINDGKSVVRLEYEAQEELCNKEAKKILDEAREKFHLIDVRCYHRTGSLNIGEMAVWVGVLAGHRDNAFKACRYVIDELKKRLPIWKKEFYADGESGWVSAQKEQQSELPFADAHELSESNYYSRQINLPEVGEPGQKKLKAAKVLVVGAGGLGCPALMSLAGAGVGTIGICEHDKVELNNLHRQFLYSFDDVGKHKVQVARDRINAMNPSVTINTHDQNIHVENVEEIVGDYDIVLDCTDNVETKYLLNDACFLMHKTLVQSGIYQWEGQLRVMMPRQKGCLRCLWPNIPDPGCAGTCVDGGVVGVIPNIFGHLQAMEAIRIILDMQKVFENELLILNVADFHVRRLKIKPETVCPLCGEAPAITAIEHDHYQPQAEHLVDVKRLEENILNEFVFVDIREDEERQSDPLTGVESEHVPMSRITEGDDGPFRGEKKYLLFCSKGVRSSRLAQMVREMGRDNVYSAKDGIEAIRERLKTIKS